MNRPNRRASLASVTLVCVALGLQGCGVSTSTASLSPGPEPVEITMTPAVVTAGSSVQVRVVSPSADSIIVESDGGIDRYSATGGSLRARLQSNFGDTLPEMRYAVRQNGRLFNVLKKP